ncbi:MAG: LLM class F420-dependent oxidoreductase [Proteobacteria bacterium]|nr:LLM class F420-dependent oxidoreductase [Pseudomonadota bacterium]
MKGNIMQIGFSAPTAGPLAALDPLVRLCTGAEEAGLAYATFSDHVVIPTEIASPYPYSATGEFTNQGTGERNEQLIELAFVAARTGKLKLVTSVMVVPHRPAVLAAKQLATIDVLSGGRVILGIGAGWMKEEFEAIGAPPFAERGKVTDEYVAAFKELWTKDRPSFAGAYVKFDKITFAPKPAQKGGIPIWVGGESGPALRRTARYGDAWYPIPNNPAFPMDSLGRLTAGIARLRQLTAEAGRDPKSVGVTVRFPRWGEGLPAKAGDGERKLFSGTPADIASDIKALAKLGVGAIDTGFSGSTVPEILADMKKFKSEVLARL